MHHSTLNRNLKGDVIDSRAKESKSTEVDGTSRFVGHRFLLKTRLYGDKKCIYCGRWFHWRDSDYLTWMQQGNIDRTNKDRFYEPAHCGSEHCQDWHELWRREKERRMQMSLEQETWRLFQELKSRNVIK